MADQNTFDPNKPYEAAPPEQASTGEFDPNQPYEAAPSTLDVAKANVAKYPHEEAQQENHWMGKLVPQAATPIMSAISESYPIRKSEEIAQKGAALGGEVGAGVGEAAVTGANIIRHPIRSLEQASGVDFSNPMKSQFQPQPVTKTPEQVAEEEHPLAMGISRGVGRGVGETVGGLADPRMIALTVATWGAGDALPLLNKVASAGFAGQMGTHAVEAATDLARNWNVYTPEQRAQKITDAGLSAYMAKEALGHTGVPGAISDKVAPVAQAGVRGAGKAAELATSPVGLGTAVGGAVDYLGTKAGVPMHGTAEAAGGFIGREAAKAAGRNPYEPMVRFPRLTEFGKKPAPRELPPIQEVPAQGSPEAIRKNLVPAKEAAGEYTAPKETGENKGLEVLKTAYDKANADFQKAHEAREAYRASMDQGIAPPAAVQKAYEKAEKALDEAQMHYQMGEERAAQKPIPTDEAQGIREKLVPAKEAAQQGPENVKKPGEVAPERVRMNRGFEAEPTPTIRGGVNELPGGGTMGKPLQLPGEVPTEAPEHANLPEIRSKLVPAKEAAGEYTEPAAAPISKTVGKIGELTREGLGGTELKRNEPIAKKPVGEVIPPEKRTPYEPSAEAKQAWASAEKYLGENPFEEPVEGEVKTEPKTIEGEVKPQEEVKLSSRPDKATLQKSGAGPEDMEKLLNLTNVELRQLAINAGEDMGQQAIGRGKQSGNAGRHEVFERLLKNHTPEELGKMVDDGAHLPTVSGGSQGATTELPKPNTKEAAELDTDLFRRAKEALGPDASISDVAKTAQAMKAEIYSGPERRATPRTKPLSPKELEEAMAQRKPTTTPFDVTEGAKKTIEADKNMPENPQTAKGDKRVLKGANDFNKAQGRDELTNDRVEKPEERSADIAKAYEEMQHNPDNPEVKKSYKALVNDVKKQWNFATKTMGINIEPTEEDPYSSHEEMMKDIKDNKRLKVFTGGNPLPEGHPLAAVDPKTGESYNTMFRAVHDLFGHAAQGNDFSEAGEENAWRAHKQMMSPDAVPAMTTETRGQTSWLFNNGGKFADQKAGLLPDFATERSNAPTKDLSPQQIAEWHNDHRGFSYNPEKGMLRGQKVYSVAGEYPELEKVIPGQNISTKAIQEFMDDPKVQKALKDDPRNSIGGWFYKGNSHLEVSKIFDNKDEAVEEGKKLNQVAVYDHANKDLIPTGGDAADQAAAEQGKPQATMQTARMSDEELKKAGFTQEQIDNGDHLPTVSGGKISKTEAEQLAKEHLGEGEQFKSEAGRNTFIKKLMDMPSVQEFKDIAKAGETGRDWYVRSQKAFDSLVKAAPKYFQEGDRDKFTDFVAALSPQQTVKMDLQEALHAWSKYIDMGRPEDKELESMLRKEVTLPDAKVPNALKALKGEPLWPDISKNSAFKVPSFAANLRGFMDKVTNDGWQAAFSGLPATLGSAQSYHPLSVVTRAAAKELGWDPAAAQAAIWVFTKTLTEHGEKSPENIGKYSEDFADILAHDHDVRNQLSELGVDLGELDGHLKEIERKPEVSAGASPTTENSIRKLASRLEKQRGKLPQPKDSGLFDRIESEQRENFFKPRAEKKPNEGTDFEFGANEPIRKQVRMKR